VDCLIEKQGEWWVCCLCGFGEGVMREPFRQRCPARDEEEIKLRRARARRVKGLRSGQLRRFVKRYQGDCRGSKVGQEVYLSRAEKCDSCERGNVKRCLVTGIPFRVILPFKSHRCPEGRFEAVKEDRP
jgi:hypothetical protein